MSESEEFYNFLFEVSNATRHRILLILQKDAMRITEIAIKLNLNHTEIRRHLTRLREIDLIKRDVDGFYYLTPYGETCLLLLKEFNFLSTNKEYLKTHILSGLPTQYIKRVSELNETRRVDNAINFFHLTEILLRESKDYVWMLVEQFPMNSLASILDSIERGVNFRIVEIKDRLLDTDLEELLSEKSPEIRSRIGKQLVAQRMVNKVDLCLFLSDSHCVLAFPTLDGKYDYTGFSGTDEKALNWSKDVFEFYWDEAEIRRSTPTEIKIDRGRIREGVLSSVVIEARDDPRIDTQAVQYAVDNFNEVTLRGRFNFGPQHVKISKSVVIRGEGRENGVPQTSIYKKGWSFPFREFSEVFFLDSEDIDVTIENIQFTDFNCSCIRAGDNIRLNSLKILNNRITLNNGYGRGVSYADMGDLVHGILAECVGKGGVHVEGNFIDLAHGGGWWGKSVSVRGLEENPEHRPNLFNHEYFIGFGIAVNACLGDVRIVNNVVRNANGRGIAVSAHTASTKVTIRENVVESDVYGSYPFSSRESGAGILAHIGFGKNRPGYRVNIEDNTIKLERLNYCGIIVLGPSAEGSGKLSGVIRQNDIKVDDGYEAIHVRKCDDFEVTNNKISGKAYYGIRLSGRKPSDELDLSAMNNIIEDNDMDSLAIKKPDKYSNDHADGRMFASSTDGSVTANLWLDSYTKHNSVKVKQNESIIDEGQNNSVKYV